MEKTKENVRLAFTRIARRYDLMNSLTSFGVDKLWRQSAVTALELKRNQHILDLCAGTLTLSADVLGAAEDIRVAALDFCHDMLQVGTERLPRESLARIDLVCADGEKIPFRDSVFDGTIMAYGIRNLCVPGAGLAEVYRVLKPGGRLVILEFTRPDNPLFGSIYSIYKGLLMPAAGSLITGSRQAYKYLSRSIEEFMEPEDLIRLMEETGFEKAACSRLTLGIVGVYTAVRPWQS